MSDVTRSVEIPDASVKASCSYDAVGIPSNSSCPARHPKSGALCIESPGHEGEHRAMGVSRLQWFGANLREAGANTELPHLITTNNTGYFWCSCSPNHARVFTGLREHVAEISSPTRGGDDIAAPPLNREAVWRAVYSAAIQHLNPSGVADKATDAVLALLSASGDGGE